MSNEVKKIRKAIIEYIREEKKECGIDDFSSNMDLYDGFDLGVSVVLRLLKEVFYGIE